MSMLFLKASLPGSKRIEYSCLNFYTILYLKKRHFFYSSCWILWENNSTNNKYKHIRYRYLCTQSNGAPPALLLPRIGQIKKRSIIMFVHYNINSIITQHKHQNFISSHYYFIEFYFYFFNYYNNILLLVFFIISKKIIISYTNMNTAKGNTLNLRNFWK